MTVKPMTWLSCHVYDLALMSVISSRGRHEATQRVVARDFTLVTRWWSFKLRMPTLLALVEFYFYGGNNVTEFFSRWWRVGVGKEIKIFCALYFFQNYLSQKEEKSFSIQPFLTSLKHRPRLSKLTNTNIPKCHITQEQDLSMSNRFSRVAPELVKLNRRYRSRHIQGLLSVNPKLLSWKAKKP